MSSNNSSSGNSNRNGFIFPDFSLRRLLMQTRTGRAPFTTRMCDVERGASNSSNGVSSNGIANIANNKHEKTGHGSSVNGAGDVSSNKVSPVLHSYANLCCDLFISFLITRSHFINENIHRNTFFFLSKVFKSKMKIYVANAMNVMVVYVNFFINVEVVCYYRCLLSSTITAVHKFRKDRRIDRRE